MMVAVRSEYRSSSISNGARGLRRTGFESYGLRVLP